MCDAIVREDGAPPEAGVGGAGVYVIVRGGVDANAVALRGPGIGVRPHSEQAWLACDVTPGGWTSPMAWAGPVRDVIARRGWVLGGRPARQGREAGKVGLCDGRRGCAALAPHSGARFLEGSCKMRSVRAVGFVTLAQF